MDNKTIYFMSSTIHDNIDEAIENEYDKKMANSALTKLLHSLFLIIMTLQSANKNYPY